MLVRRRKSWEVPERHATPESVFLDRRALLAGGAGLLAAGAMAPHARAFSLFGSSKVYGPPADDPSAGLYPFRRNDAYKLDRDVTPEGFNYTYNNYYEFGSSKEISEPAQALKIRPWTVTFDGMVEAERVVDIDTLLAAMPLEERLYRHRCVEAWSMTVPWSGFALAELVKYAKPLSGAKYVRMETFMDPKVARGQSTGSFGYPWPYVEGLTIEEATNDLAFMVTGAYGKPLPKQMGSPLRLATPWKYGFKSIKGIVKFTFTDERPVSFWEDILPREYGFWANVNPEVPHPRWSQAEERVLGTREKVPTLPFNGYGEQVAGLYPKDAGREFFM
ncbi:MAG: protein-methionine-sulfoxide reductase catalytic subunit MsrP [Rhodobiaceae bacterium]|nr:protein-methionine-sulfoxide reductase catalytic subunit MsrP [Rhodobiaceae bacterium]MCC0053510.1 protein-methionine-sulfoxide reductase catalytic subunit MsrP [Rhodobiaceae bacterium]